MSGGIAQTADGTSEVARAALGELVIQPAGDGQRGVTATQMKLPTLGGDVLAMGSRGLSGIAALAADTLWLMEGRS